MSNISEPLRADISNFLRNIADGIESENPETDEIASEISTLFLKLKFAESLFDGDVHSSDVLRYMSVGWYISRILNV